MAMIYYSKKPLFLPLVAFITTFLVLLHKANSEDVVSFSFPEFNASNAKDLTLDGDASIFSSLNALRLTRVDSNGIPLAESVGRASYSNLVHLWDASTGASAGFTTSFVFRITSPSDPNNPADGLTFFIASPTLPLGTSGGNLGLFSGSPPSDDDRAVAVEFDTYINSGIPDPGYTHVGVDVNNKKSVFTEKWEWVNGDGVQVTISYVPFGNVLRVIASNFSGARVEFTYEIDLAAKLPEYVKVGFTASTGGVTQINDIINWSFHSVLDSKHVAEEGAHIASVVM